MAVISSSYKLNSRVTGMYISLANSRTAGFKKWADGQRAGNDDDQPGGAAPILKDPPFGGETQEALPHRPWVVPGVGGSF
jgi:hypothetical protein